MAALARPIKQALSDDPILSKLAAETVIQRTFIVRVFVAMWNAIRAAWVSLIQRDVARAAELAEEERAAIGAKQVDEEKPEQRVQVSQTHRQINPPFPSPSSASTHAAAISYPSEKDTLHTPLAESDLLRPMHPLVAPDTSTISSGGTSRTTPPASRKMPFHLQQKTLVLDLDETLIHSTSRPIFSSGSGGSGLLALGGFGKKNKGAGHVVEVVLGGKSTLYHVYKRPFVDYFLRKVDDFQKHVQLLLLTHIR